MVAIKQEFHQVPWKKSKISYPAKRSSTQKRDMAVYQYCFTRVLKVAIKAFEVSLVTDHS
jgi:hypothetical protein